jgi:hypothetical protein
MKTRTVKGKIVYFELGLGFYGIIDEDGRKWRPVKLPTALQKNELKGTFSLREVTEDVSIYMWGKPVEIIEYSLAE